MFGKKVLVAMSEGVHRGTDGGEYRLRKIVDGVAVGMAPQSFGDTRILVQVKDLLVEEGIENVFFRDLGYPTKWTNAIVNENAKARGIDINETHGTYDVVACESMGSCTAAMVSHGEME